MKLAKQILTISLTFLFVFIVVNTQLNEYIPFILALVIIFSVIFMVLRRRQNKGADLFIGSNSEVFSITSALLFMVFLTGGIQSALFFLLYFLLFGMAFLFEPPTIFVFLLGLFAVFGISVFQDDVFGNIIKVGSLAFLTPIAYFFGREFKRREELEKKIEKNTDKILSDVEKIANKEGSADELEDILNQTEDLQEEAKK